MPTGDYFSYDRRGRGLITMHCISSTAPSQQPCSSVQNPPQDSYQYDVQDRLISISHLGSKLEDLSYDAAGRLVGRAFPSAPNTPDSARYYIGDDLTVVVGSTSSPRTVGYAHVRLGGKRIASIWAKSAGSTSTNGTIYYHRDSRSSVVATTTAGGNIGISYRYLPSGAVDKVAGTEADETASELGFIGGIKLSGGLVHLRARAYSPLLRRFLQPDTIDLRRYTYAHGDPLNFVDPTGREAVQPVTPGVAVDPDISASGAAAQATLSPQEGGVIPVATDPQPTPTTIGPLQQAYGGPAPTSTVSIGTPLNGTASEGAPPTMGQLPPSDPPGTYRGLSAAGLAPGVSISTGGTSGLHAFIGKHPVAFWGGLLVGAVAIALAPQIAAVATPIAASIIRFGPTNPGPLPERVANTFRSATYSANTLANPTTLFRAWGGTASQVGQFWTRTAPTGPLQAAMDLGLNPAWGNTAANITSIEVPAGVTIFEGVAAAQGCYLGGGSQVFIPLVNPAWINF
jgi:RHS repeat-associated protein